MIFQIILSKIRWKSPVSNLNLFWCILNMRRDFFEGVLHYDVICTCMGDVGTCLVSLVRGGELSAAELPDLLMNGHKSTAYIKYKICCLQVQINQVYAIVTKWQIVMNISNKMLCKNSSNINILLPQMSFWSYVPRMLQQEGILSVL